MPRRRGLSRRDFFRTGAAGAAAAALPPAAGAEAPTQPAGGSKVFMITDMEGVSGIFDTDLQCLPNACPRWAEAHQLQTGEVNAAVDGLMEGGATEVVVWDGHDGSRSLSALDIHPKCRLLTGEPVSPTLELDRSYRAMLFIGQHAMAGAKKGILNHSYSSLGVQNMWINNRRAGEIGGA